MIQGFFRLIAALILVLVVIALPVSLLMKEVSDLAFDPETTKELIIENLLDTDFMADVARNTVEDMLSEGVESDEPASVVVARGLEELDEETWQQLTQLIAPADLLAETTNEVVDAYAEWLNSDAPLPDLQLNLAPWKQNAISNARLIVALIVDQLPACTLEEIADQALEGLSGDSGIGGLIPTCRPPEPIYSTLIENSDTLVSGFLRATPDTLNMNLAAQASGGNFDRLNEFKANLNRARFVLTWSWVAVGGLGILAVALAARSWPSALKWAGWPLLFSGLVTLVFGLGFVGLGSFFLERILDAMLADGPALAGLLLGSAAGGVLELVGDPLVTYGAVMGGLGLVSLWGSSYLASQNGELVGQKIDLDR